MGRKGRGKNDVHEEQSRKHQPQSDLKELLMDKVTHDMVVGQLKAASTPADVTTALVSAMIAVVDCQMATGNRVKKQSLWIAGIVVVLAVALLFGTDAARQFVMFGRGN